MTLNQIKSFKLKDFLGKIYDETVPTLEELVDLVKSFKKFKLIIEVKVHDGNKRYFKYLKKFLEKNSLDFRKFHFSSYNNLDFLILLRKNYSDMHIGYIVDKIESKTIPSCVEYKINSIECWYLGIDSQDITRALDHDIDVNLY